MDHEAAPGEEARDAPPRPAPRAAARPGAAQARGQQTTGVMRKQGWAPRGSGGKQLAQILGVMFGVVALLVLLAIWGAHNG